MLSTQPFIPMTAWIGLLASLLTMSSYLSAESTQDKYAVIYDSIARINPQIKAQSITPISVNGMVRVILDTGDTLYMTEDGEHFFAGTLFSNQAGVGLVNITENDQKLVRKQLLTSDVAQQAWVFPAQQPKQATITVFTDVDCYYCQKLHAEMADITELGIEVRYLAFPRAGIGSSSYQVLVDAWCAENPNEFMTEAKRRSHNKLAPQASTPACDNPVDEHYALSQKMSLRGTPAILLDDGTLWPGYLPADVLAQRLNIN